MNQNPLLPRKQALETGATKYLAARPCKNGHHGARYMSGNCVQCVTKSTSDGKRRNRRTLSSGSVAKRLSAIKTECASSGAPFQLSVVEVMRLYAKDPICPVTKRKMVRPGDHGANNDQVCIEAVNRELGLTSGNIVLISREAQRLLRSTSLGQMKRLCEIFS